MEAYTMSRRLTSSNNNEWQRAIFGIDIRMTEYILTLRCKQQYECPTRDHNIGNFDRVEQYKQYN